MLEKSQYLHKLVEQAEIIPPIAIDGTATTLLKLAVLEFSFEYCVNEGITLCPYLRWLQTLAEGARYN